MNLKDGLHLGEREREREREREKISVIGQFKRSPNTIYLTLEIFTIFHFLFKHFPTQSEDHMQTWIQQHSPNNFQMQVTCKWINTPPHNSWVQFLIDASFQFYWITLPKINKETIYDIQVKSRLYHSLFFHSSISTSIKWKTKTKN